MVIAAGHPAWSASYLRREAWFRLQTSVLDGSPFGSVAPPPLMKRTVQSSTVSTVVIQSYRTVAVPVWIETCMQSVRDWALSAEFSYEFVGDEIFDLLPDDYRQAAVGRIPVLTDLGRLLLIRRALEGRFDRAIWVDADVLVFHADCLSVPANMDYAFCREVWVQTNHRRPHNLKCFRNVHNAFCLFERGNPFLDFYIHACERIVGAAAGPNAQSDRRHEISDGTSQHVRSAASGDRGHVQSLSHSGRRRWWW